MVKRSFAHILLLNIIIYFKKYGEFYNIINIKKIKLIEKLYFSLVMKKTYF